MDRNTGALIISRAKRLDDSGLFTCVAESESRFTRFERKLIISQILREFPENLLISRFGFVQRLPLLKTEVLK